MAASRISSVVIVSDWGSVNPEGTTFPRRYPQPNFSGGAAGEKSAGKTAAFRSFPLPTSEASCPVISVLSYRHREAATK